MRTEDADARWRRVDALFGEALDREPDERAAFLDRACGADNDLRRAVEALLASHAAAGHFLDDPADWFEVPPLPAEDLAREEPAAGDGAAEASRGGQRIGAYRLVGKLGEGGMGSVYLAERADGQFEHRAALKLVRSGLASDDLRRRFRQERQILARLNHPNIARLFDGGVLEGPGGQEQPYLVMELVEGEPLATYCRRRRLPVAARLALFAEVCEAVAYAHAMLVVHRDLKPGNVLVAEDEHGRPRVKLLDFGIARLLEDDGAAGEVGARTLLPALTPEYAAPEQVRGEPATTATDVYALGVVLYELLTGHRPYQFTRLTPAEVERVVCEQEPERPSAAVARPPGTAEPGGLRRRLRGDLDAVVLKALRKEPAARYATADALLEDVRRHLAGLPVSAHAPTVGYRAGKFVRRHRWGVAAAAAFAMLLIGATTVTAVQSRQVRLEAEKATRVTDFLLSLFEASDPNVARGDTLTAGALMARGLREADALRRQPEVQAEMLEVIGRTYGSMGRPDLADAPLGRALALRRRLHPEPHPALARSLYWAALNDTYQEDYGRAEQRLREALALQRELLDPADPDLGATMFKLAGTLHSQGRSDEADALVREATRIFRDLPAAPDPETIRYLTEMAQYLYYSRHFADAETFYRRAIQMQRAYYGDAHPELAANLLDLAMLLRRTRRYEESERLSHEGLAMAVAQLGPQHEVVQLGRLGLAQLLSAQGRYAEAEPLLRQVLDAPPYLDGQTKAGVLRDLGGVLTGQGRFEEAEAVLQQGLRLQEEVSGVGSVYSGDELVALGRLECLRGNYEVAEAYLTRARAIYASSLRAGHLWTAGPLQELGHVKVATGAFAEAEPLLRESLAIQEQNPPVQPFAWTEVQRLLGVALTRLGRYEEAEVRLRASLRTAEEVARPDLAEQARQALRDLSVAQSRPRR